MCTGAAAAEEEEDTESFLPGLIAAEGVERGRDLFAASVSFRAGLTDALLPGLTAANAISIARSFAARLGLITEPSARAAAAVVGRSPSERSRAGGAIACSFDSFRAAMAERDSTLGEEEESFRAGDGSRAAAATDAGGAAG